jgi:uncharacterized membrane protein
LAKISASHKELIMKLSLVLLPIVLTSWLNVAFASTTTNAANPNAATTAYKPVHGQAGKDVIWIPTPPGLIDKMVKSWSVGTACRPGCSSTK